MKNWASVRNPRAADSKLGALKLGAGKIWWPRESLAPVRLLGTRKTWQILRLEVKSEWENKSPADRHAGIKVCGRAQNEYHTLRSGSEGQDPKKEIEKSRSGNTGLERQTRTGDTKAGGKTYTGESRIKS
jgi:hypothetical protein